MPDRPVSEHDEPTPVTAPQNSETDAVEEVMTLSYGGQQLTRHQAEHLVRAAAPHLTGPLAAEIEALRAELEDYSTQYGEQRDELIRERARTTAVADALTAGAPDLVGALSGEWVKDNAGDLVRRLTAEVARLAAAHESTRRGYLRVETQRDDLRTAVLDAAGVDPDTANEDTDYLDVLAKLRAELESLREGLIVEYAGFRHPAWPDPVEFQYGDDHAGNAARWYADNIDQHPQIQVRRRVRSGWVVVDASSAAALRGDDRVTGR